jgi:hypothetical protein
MPGQTRFTPVHPLFLPEAVRAPKEVGCSLTDSGGEVTCPYLVRFDGRPNGRRGERERAR